jgi:hypothetical protein
MEPATGHYPEPDEFSAKVGALDCGATPDQRPLLGVLLSYFFLLILFTTNLPKV